MQKILNSTRVLHEFLMPFAVLLIGSMSDHKFFDGCDNGEGLPTTFRVPAEEMESIEKLEKIVSVEIDRSRTQSNHLNKMMRTLIKHQQDVQKQTAASYQMLSAQIDEQISNFKDPTPTPHHTTSPHSPIANSCTAGRYDSPLNSSPASSAGGDETTPPDPTIINSPNSNASTPPDPAVVDISSERNDVDQPDDDDLEVKIAPERVAAALKARGIPKDFKANLEFNSVCGPRLLVTRQTRLEGKAEERVQEFMFKLAAGFAHVMGWPQPLPCKEIFTGAPDGACDCDVLHIM